jgi:peptide chain release factor 3
VIGVVGQLQLEVLTSRLSAEYKVESNLEAAPFATARWLIGDDADIDAFANINRGNMAKDRDDNAVFLAKSPWDVNYQQEKHPKLNFSATKER